MEHQFNVQLAKEYGIEEAILIHNIFFWIKKNAANDKHLYDGHYWTYNTQKALSDLFPYINETKIQRCIKGLCERGIIIKGNYNKNKLDRTCWYAFTDKAISILQNDGYDVGKMKNASSHNEATIPDSKHTDSNTDKKKEIYKEIVDFWNENTKTFSKVRSVTAKVKSYIDARIRDGYSVDDIKKALLLCESLDDFYKGKQENKKWKADFFWIMANTNANFDKILTGALHTTNEQQREYKKIINGEEYNPNEYHPTSNGGSVHWNEQTQCYYCFNPWDFYQFTDGYTNETRPDGAAVFCQGVKYIWSREKKEWIQSR